MENKLNRKLYIIPAVYLLLGALFFYQHYSQRKLFSQSIGNIELTSQSTKGTLVNSSEIKKLNMYANGISFPFSSSNSLSVRTSDDILHFSKLKNFESNEESFILHFENNISLIFKTDFADNKISIIADLPETVPPIKELNLPFLEDRGFSLTYSEEDNTPVITNGETNYFITLTNEFKLDNDNRVFVIETSESSPITFMIQETLVNKGRTAEKWYGQNDTNISAEYNTALSNFVNNAFFGWNSRFNSKTGMWTDGSGVQQFNEITAMSYLSESLIRGSYRTSASLIRTASVNLENSLTASTAPYLGNIVVKGRQLITSQLADRRKINTLIQEEDRELLQIENLINIIRNIKLEEEIPNIVNMALIKSNNESLSDTMNRLEIIIDAYDTIIDSNLDSKILDIIEKTLLPSVSWLDEGLFLHTDDIINVEESFHFGKLLTDSGKILSNDFYTSVGEQMIVSVLARAKESAILPENITIKDNRIFNETGTLLPEKIYRVLTENPYYTKQENLTETLGAGSWILTAAKDYSIQANGKETTININFPKASIHHFAIKGIKPFTRIYMHNVKWNSDPNFQRYSDGWVYDKASQTLYIKLKHRVDNEQIKILYYYPEAELSSSTESKETTAIPAVSETKSSSTSETYNREL